MLRSDTIICGTSTTGSGTLTLAACPAPPGGVDLYTWLTATGFAFVNGNALIVSYVIIEYTDSTYATAKQFEKGVGTVTLGASLTASTLARMTIQSVASSLNAAPASPTYQGPSAVSIGTAANTLIFVGPSAADTIAYGPYYDSSTVAAQSGNLDGLGVQPVTTGGPATGGNLTTLQDYYSIFEWRVPMVVKRCSMHVNTAYSGSTGTPISAAYGRIYQVGSNGRPGKLLVDFGAFSSTNPLNTAQNISTTALTNGFLLLPGEYYFNFMPSFSGATGTVTAPAMTSSQNFPACGRMGTVGQYTVRGAYATGGTAGAGPDPANTTGWTPINANATPFFPYAALFSLAAS